MKFFKPKLFNYVAIILFVILVPLFSYSIVYGLSSYDGNLSIKGISNTSDSGGDYYQYPRPSINSPVSGQMVSGNVTIEIYSPGANWVKCKIWDRQSSVLIKESDAIRSDNSGKWFSFWDTKTIRNNAYYIVAYSYFPNATNSYSYVVDVNVANSPTTGDSSRSGTTPVTNPGTTNPPSNTSQNPVTSQNANTTTSGGGATTPEMSRESIAYQKMPELVKAPVSKKLNIDEAKVTMLDSEKGKVTLKGKANPNTTLFLYIFSDPIIVSIKSDDEGNWSYTLDNPIESGEHEVYIAIKNDKGEISERSEALNFFVGQAAAASEADAQKKEDTSVNSNNYLLYYLLIAATLVIFALSIILIWKFKKHSKINE